MRPKAEHSMMPSAIVQYLPQQRHKRCERPQSAWASAAIRTLARAVRSNIQAGTSSRRHTSALLKLQRKTTLADLSTTS